VLLRSIILKRLPLRKKILLQLQLQTLPTLHGMATQNLKDIFTIVVNVNAKSKMILMPFVTFLKSIHDEHHGGNGAGAESHYSSGSMKMTFTYIVQLELQYTGKFV
jgi:hypothetical protein